jgi:hypothetical protein
MSDKVLRVLGLLAGSVGISAGAFFLIESFDSLLPEAIIFWSLACFLVGGFSFYWAQLGLMLLVRLIGEKTANFYWKFGART